jgi:putative transposase
MKDQKRKSYESDLTDKEWNIIEPLLPPPNKEGKPRDVNIRDVIDAINYLLKSGCTWRLIPHDFPKWQLVYYYFKLWKKKGVWKRLHNKLRKKVRQQSGKKAFPTAGVIDSQSVKTVKKGELVAMMPARK